MRPRFLQHGDQVALVAPGKRITDAIVHRAQIVVRQWGFVPVASDELSAEAHLYHGTPAAVRKQALQAWLNDKNIRAILCLRGGYGTTQFLDDLAWSSFLQDPKWIIGFSDITALHLQLSRLGVESLHASMPIQWDDNQQATAITRLHDLLIGRWQPLAWGPQAPNRPGSAEGVALGGNLSLLTDSLATGNEVELGGKILFIEEVDEPLYRIDRMLTQLKRAGKLSQLAGVVVGYFTNTQTASAPYGQELSEVVLAKVPTNIPVSFGCPFGHDAPNEPWVSGARVKLRVEAAQSIIEYL
jgi:muramoyltetrapeptide carboxypeptidase